MNRYRRIDRCPVDVYIPSNMAFDYPYKLQKPEYASERIRETCETYILDSGIGDDTTNEDVLALSHDLDADFVVPCDVLHNQTATTEAVTDFLDLWETHPTRATPLIPLQPPHDAHYEALPDQFAYMLGGISPSLTDYTTQDVINSVRRFRDTAGMGPYLHLLGVGASPALADWLAQHPNMVQSIDVSTPEQVAINGKIVDTRLRQHQFDIRQGKGSSTTRADVARLSAMSINEAITERMAKTTLQDYA